jgi:nucleotide-binding universal stress UspA family protein
MNLRKIITALDRSPQTLTVFEQALEQAQIHNGELMVLHSIRPEAPVRSGPFLGIGTVGDVATYGELKRSQQEHEQQEVAKAQAWLETYCQQARDRGIAVKCSCQTGEPAAWICEMAKNWQADLIILGRRGHRGLAEIMLGSVSNYVVHHAPCSVLVVQGTNSAHSM